MYPAIMPEHVYKMTLPEGKQRALKILRDCAELVHYRGARPLAMEINEMADNLELSYGSYIWDKAHDRETYRSIWDSRNRP